MAKNKSRTYLLALLPFLILIALSELVPVGTMLVQSFLSNDGGGFTFANYIRIFSKQLYRSAVINSVWISLAASLIGVLIAFFGARAAWRKGGRAKRIFMGILNMVSNFSGVPLAFAYIIMLGNTGILTMIGQRYGIDFLARFPLYSTLGLMIVYIYFEIPLAVLLLIPVFNQIRPEWIDAVEMMGGNRRVFWRKVGIPVLMPAVMSTFSTMFANAISAYATAYALLTNNISILPIRISQQYVGDVIQNPHLGGALAVVLMALMVLSILINQKVVKNSRLGRSAA